jgi:hypothetical protein
MVELMVMNNLRYTNAALTIIALVLSVIAIENIVGSSSAQSTSVQPVAICDFIGDGRACLDVERGAQGSYIKVRVVQ